MMTKLRSMLTGGHHQTALILVSPDAPPKGGVFSLAPPKKPKDKTQYIYSADHVGGKGANLLRLRAAGLNVPPFLLIPASECEEALQRASEMGGGSVESWISGEGPSDNAKICEALDKVELSEEVIAHIKQFVGSENTKAFAVRSSATVEDGSDSAYAGQFVTELNIHGVEHVIAAVKACWKSLLADTVRPYYIKANEKRPRMAVVIQQQIDSDKAGVYFQANPVTGATSTHIVNAALGQGEGVVSGTVASDEFWLSAETGECFKRVIATKSERIALAEAKDGTRKDPVDSEAQNAPVLTDDQLKQLHQESKKIRATYSSPQDVEFSFSKEGELFILQARPITTRLEQLKFEPNDIGLWRLNSHIAVPMSALYEPIWLEGWSKGCLSNSKLTGSGFVACDTIALNGFGYFCLRFPGPKAPPTAPPPKMLMKTILYLTGGKDTRAARAFWEKKGYLNFAQEFQQTLKPQWISRHRAMQEAAEKVTTAEEAVAHLKAAYAHFSDAWYAHVTYTLYQMLPASYFVQRARGWSGCSEAEAWAALEGFSPVTKGLTGEFPAEVKALSQDATAMDLLRSSAPPEQVLGDLAKLPGDVGASAAKIIGDMKYRLMGGYDPANAIIKESPGFLVSLIRTACEAGPAGEGSEDAERAAGEIRAKIAENKRAEFDSLLLEIRSIMKLRDERAIYTDLWGAGILHDAVVRCADFIDKNNIATANASGARLVKLVLEGSLEEIVDATSKGVTPELIELWKERKLHRETASIRDAPGLIGGVDVEITPEHFPNEWLARSFSTIMMSTKLISTPPDFEQQYKDLSGTLNDSKKTVIGLPASKGTVEGIACILKSEEDVVNVQKGQIIITESPSSLINLVLPLASAIVCDFGATLSHAAVCARELNIPCVVGTKIATKMIKDGQKVRVNGSTGVVELTE